MYGSPASEGPGRDGGLPRVPPDARERSPTLLSPDWTLVPSSPEWPDWWDDEGFLAVADEEPGDPEEYEDPDNAPPAGMDGAKLAELIVEPREIATEQAERARGNQAGTLGVIGTVVSGRRGPGMPGSERTYPG